MAVDGDWDADMMIVSLLYRAARTLLSIPRVLLRPRIRRARPRRARRPADHQRHYRGGAERMTVKLVILYTKPDDVDAFEAHYRGVHIPLVEALPGLQRWESARVTGSPDRHERALHRMTELHFTDDTSLQAALHSPQGRATSQDFRQIAPPGSRTFTVSAVPPMA